MIQLTKIDAARRQLQTAIRLFFMEVDPVSTHTLASAAQEILRGLLKAKGLASTSIKDSDLVPTDKRKLWFEAVNHEQNFLKHADRDPDGTLVYNPELLPYVLHDASSMYSALNDGVLVVEVAAFIMWFVVHYPELLIDDTGRRAAERLLDARTGGANDHQTFHRMLEDPDSLLRDMREFGFSTG
jgi:hypothetical protein